MNIFQILCTISITYFGSAIWISDWLNRENKFYIGSKRKDFL